MPESAAATSPDQSKVLSRLSGPHPGVPPTPAICTTARLWRPRVTRGPGGPRVLLSAGVLALPQLGRPSKPAQRFNFSAVTGSASHGGQEAEGPVGVEDEMSSGGAVAALSGVLDSLEEALASSAPPRSPLPGAKEKVKHVNGSEGDPRQASDGVAARPSMRSGSLSSTEGPPRPGPKDSVERTRTSRMPTAGAAVIDLNRMKQLRKSVAHQLEPTPEFFDSYASLGTLRGDLRHPAWISDSDEANARRAAQGRMQEARRDALQRLLGSGQASVAAEAVHRRGRSKPLPDNRPLLRSTLKAMVTQRRELAEAKQLLQEVVGATEIKPEPGARRIRTTRTRHIEEEDGDSARRIQLVWDEPESKGNKRRSAQKAFKGVARNVQHALHAVT